MEPAILTPKARAKRVKALKEEIKVEARAERIGGFGGKPRSFTKPEQLQEFFDLYFQECDELRKMPNTAGLSVFMGMSRETLYQYAKQDGYSDIFKRSEQVLEDKWLQILPRAPIGAIFFLKNKHGYRDQLDHTSGGAPIQFILPAEISVKHQLVAPEVKELPANE